MAMDFSDKKCTNWHDFEKDAAEYFERSHQSAISKVEKRLQAVPLYDRIFSNNFKNSF